MTDEEKMAIVPLVDVRAHIRGCIYCWHGGKTDTRRCSVAEAMIEQLLRLRVYGAKEGK